MDNLRKALLQARDLRHTLELLYIDRANRQLPVNEKDLNHLAELIETCVSHPAFADQNMFSKKGYR